MKVSDHPGKAVVLLSGGVDSATTLAIARAEGWELNALSIDYGQRHLRELASAKMVAEFFRVKKHLIVNFNLRDIGGSALTSDIEVPKAGFSDLGLGVSKMNSAPIPDPQSPIPNPQSLLPMCLPATLSSSPLLLHGQRL